MMARLMGTMLLWVGAVLIGVAIGILIWALDPSRFSPLLEGVFCDEHESLVTTSEPAIHTDEIGMERERSNISFYCVDQVAGNTREISSNVLLLAAGMIMSPLIIGAALVVRGQHLWRRNRDQIELTD